MWCELMMSVCLRNFWGDNLTPVKTDLVSDGYKVYLTQKLLCYFDSMLHKHWLLLWFWEFVRDVFIVYKKILTLCDLTILNINI